ncbi:MAG TPA: inositol monophosphatase family protein [Casimicrobiaceae bacterium]|nr:inositol monophosphatase family protein [Casimicrobiaceae bacterium]
MPISARYVAALELARAAGALARHFFSQREVLEVEHKGAQNLVSRADRAVEELIRSRLAAAFPGDGFLGEETAAAFAGDPDHLWIVDPIDGTHNFLRGVRYYCVSIAYAEQGVREIGVVYDPEHDELFHAQRGLGAFVERTGGDIRLQTSDCSELSDAFVCIGHHDRAPEPRVLALRHALMDAGTATRNMGAGALQLAHVAAGRFDGFVEYSLNAWDAMAGLLLIEEAGGYVAPFPGPKGVNVPAPVLGCARGIGEALSKVVGAWGAR